ncbi:MAG: hypothetical protein KKI08_08270 [Armatimonadetes bacterium]|nr:hypothetical protein [Armatimonadota bacterium]
MDITALSRYAGSLRNLYEGLPESDLDHALQRLAQEEQWELLALWAVTAAEVPARRIVTKLLEKERFEELALPACLRRQVRRQEVIVHNPARAKRILRDIDSEEDEGGIPEHIMQEAQDIADSAETSRMSALSREAGIDRDPLRELIVNGIAQKLNTSEVAGEVLIAIAKAGAFEDARRMAALKLANNDMVMRRLARDGRGADMIVVAENSGLESVRTNIARALGPVLGAMRAQKDWPSLRWAGKHHPDPKAREAIEKVLADEAQA